MAIYRKNLRWRLGGPGYLNDYVGDDASYETHSIWPREEKNAAINEAIRLSGDRWARMVENHSLTMTYGTYTYDVSNLTVPLDPQYGIHSILYDSGNSNTGYPFVPLDEELWELRQDDTTYTLQLKAIPRHNATLRLVYKVRPSVLNDDTTPLLPDSQGFASYIVAKAAALLLRNPKGVVKESEIGYYLQRASDMEQLAETFYSRDRRAKLTGKVRFPFVPFTGEELPINYGL